MRDSDASGKKLRIAYIFPNLKNGIEPFAHRDIQALKQLDVDVTPYSFVPYYSGWSWLSHGQIYMFVSCIVDIFMSFFTAISNIDMFLNLYRKRNSQNKRMAFRETCISILSVGAAIYLLRRLKRRKDFDFIHLFWGHYPASIIYVNHHLKLVNTKFSLFLGAYDLEHRLILSEIALQHADAIVTHSAYNKRQIGALCSKLNINSDRIVHIYRGVNIDSERFTPSEIKYPYQFSSGGRLIASKNFDDVIKIFSNLIDKSYPQASLTLFGDGPERENLQSMISEYGVNDDVILTGKLMPYDVKSLLKKMDFMLFASQKPGEILPNVIKEAMLEGVIVFTVRTDGIEELITNRVNGFVYEDIANMKSNILDDIDYAIQHSASLQSRAHKTIVTSFDVLKTMSHYKNMWNDNNVSHTQ